MIKTIFIIVSFIIVGCDCNEKTMTEDEFNRFMLRQRLINCLDEHNIDKDVSIEINDSNVIYKRFVRNTSEFTGWKLCAMELKRKSIIMAQNVKFELLMNDFARPKIENCCDNLGFEYAWNEVFQDGEQCDLFDVGVHKYYFNNVSLDTLKSILKKQLHYSKNDAYKDQNHISIGAANSQCVEKIIKELTPLGFYSYDVTSQKYSTKEEIDEFISATIRNVKNQNIKTAPNKR